MRDVRRFLAFCVLAVASLLACDRYSPSAEPAPSRDELQGQLSDLRGKVAALEVRVESANASAVSLRTELATANASLSAVEQRLATEDYAGTVAKLAVATKAVTDLESAFALPPGAVTLETKFVFGDTDLELGKAYDLGANRAFTFEEARFWLSNVKLTMDNGTAFAVPNAYYLVEVMKEQKLTNGVVGTHILPANRREAMNLSRIPAGRYTAIELAIGVDPTHNDNLSLSGGELHVLKNMTSDNGWMWLTSYVFTKLRGMLSTAGGAPVAVRWENGTNTDYRMVKRNFATPLAIGDTAPTKISIALDMKKLFDDLDPRQTPTITATQETQRHALADAWARAFAPVPTTAP